ncbi:MAG: hypothetical protein ACE5JX_18545 [Acidobacteriota bacterium]
MMPRPHSQALRARSRRTGVAGFTLLETLLSVLILTIGILATGPLVLLSTQQSELSRYRTNATMLAQRQLERIAQNKLAAAGGFSDPDGNWIQVDCLNAAQETCGSPLNDFGLIDFSQDALVSFSLPSTDPDGITYDIRWNIQRSPNGTRRIIVGVRGRAGIFLIPAVHLRTLVAP